MRTNVQKFRELILYVARRCEADPKCSATKLSKILFYSDFRAYEELGASISGEVYERLENGPAPKRFVPVLRDLEEERACVWADRYYHGKNLRKLIALREPDLSGFKPEEIDLVRDVIMDLWELNATEVSVLSRRFVGWQAADLKEEIPYGTVFVDDPRPLSAEEHEWALRVSGGHR